MKVNVGNDIIEVDRIKDSIESLGEKLLKRVYTDNEIKYCEGKSNMKYQHYAARFAAKEAVFKAISPLLSDKFKIGWKNIEVLNDANGRPYINLLSTDVKPLEINISLSHIKEYAIATAVAVIK